jgi:hypothetical protein
MLSFFTTYTLRFLLFVHPVDIIRQNFPLPDSFSFFEKKPTATSRSQCVRVGWFFFFEKKPTRSEFTIAASFSERKNTPLPHWEGAGGGVFGRSSHSIASPVFYSSNNPKNGLRPMGFGKRERAIFAASKKARSAT